MRSCPGLDLQKLSAEAIFCLISRRYLGPTGGKDDSSFWVLVKSLAPSGLDWDLLGQTVVDWKDL
jgi:hypothetical protein